MKFLCLAGSLLMLAGCSKREDEKTTVETVPAATSATDPSSPPREQSETDTILGVAAIPSVSAVAALAEKIVPGSATDVTTELNALAGSMLSLERVNGIDQNAPAFAIVAAGASWAKGPVALLVPVADDKALRESVSALAIDHRDGYALIGRQPVIDAVKEFAFGKLKTEPPPTSLRVSVNLPPLRAQFGPQIAYARKSAGEQPGAGAMANVWFDFLDQLNQASVVVATSDSTASLVMSLDGTPDGPLAAFAADQQPATFAYSYLLDGLDGQVYAGRWDPAKASGFYQALNQSIPAMNLSGFATEMAALGPLEMAMAIQVDKGFDFVGVVHPAAPEKMSEMLNKLLAAPPQVGGATWGKKKVSRRQGLEITSIGATVDFSAYPPQQAELLRKTYKTGKSSQHTFEWGFARRGDLFLIASGSNPTKAVLQLASRLADKEPPAPTGIFADAKQRGESIVIAFDFHKLVKAAAPTASTIDIPPPMVIGVKFAGGEMTLRLTSEIEALRKWLSAPGRGRPDAP